MASSPEVRIPRYSKEEHARRGTALYENKIRQLVEHGNVGRIVAIDIDSEEYELAESTLAAADLLMARLPDAQIWCVRVGYAGVHRFGVRRSVPTK